MSDIISEVQLKIDKTTKENVDRIFKSGDDISISLIQRKAKCGYFSANRVLDDMVESGIVICGKTPLSVCKMK